MSFLLSSIRSACRAPLSASTPALSRSFATTRSSQLARLTLVGRLGADPEITTTNNGTEIIKYVVGTSSGPKDDRHTSWFRVASFVNKDSPIGQRVMGLSKGTLVYLEGDATMKTFDDGEGRKQTQLSLVQTKVEVLKRPNPPPGESAPQAV